MDDTQLMLSPPPVADGPSVGGGRGLPEREGFTTLDGREMYCIPAFDDLSPFLMSVVSDCDLWMYLSSRGGLTAGRRSPEHALFGYETDDRLHHLYGVTGPLTLIRPAVADADDDERPAIRTWEPFAGVADPAVIRRRLYKSPACNSVAFEEEHDGLNLTFRYRWDACDRFGFVRTATLVNRSPHEACTIDLIDGLLNLLPAGIEAGVQQGSSCLADAYKYGEVDRESRLAIYSLSALVSDRAEPAEALHASVAWCRGLSGYRILLSARQLAAFRAGRAVQGESRVRGQRGAFLVSARLELKPGQAVSWDVVADVARTQSQVARLRRFLVDEPYPQRAVRDAVDAAGRSLVGIVASHDGLQRTADRVMGAHHFANVLFNTMRGGAFADGGRVHRDDFATFVATRNRPAAERLAAAIAALPESSPRRQFIDCLAETGDPTAIRLGHEFLPLTFGRRHGDPSRPWNRFEIRATDDLGRRVLAYQGNWRDIFQNWEAACLSHPDYFPSVIAKFANASTADGFNPYRLSQDGVDWEVPDPADPWSNIGYWGDHQVVYLTRLLEQCRRHDPAALRAMLLAPVFSYADVPYRLRPYESLLADCRNTIEFDRDADRRARARSAAMGGDGRLLLSADGEVRHVTLVEKLLVPVLAKLSNLVPGGGIWMNTQRPEWNDANNALAGHGLSVVTLCYLRRHLAVLRELFGGAGVEAFAMSEAVASWLNDVLVVLREQGGAAERRPADDVARKGLMDGLGRAFGAYRAAVYHQGLGGPGAAPAGAVAELVDRALRLIDSSIRANRRPDGLYHAYNLLALSPDGSAAGVERLPEMLEGQVAVLSAGLLSPAEALEVIAALFDSALYCPRRQSFTLYPDRPTPGFLERNVIPPGAAETVPLLGDLLAAGDRRVVVSDDDGTRRFAPGLRNAVDLSRALDDLERDRRWPARVAADRAKVLALYEEVFHHHAFTGRSGAMFGYEGLGCVYWHMVAKLLVAVQEAYFAATAAGERPAVVEQLAEAYERVRDGLGFNRTAREYGAFPTDPYSHTPAHDGARQPGMTGQVKEEILTRLGELGVHVEAGAIRLAPRLLDRHEFADEPASFEYRDVNGHSRTVDLPPRSLAFTLCQVPVVYRLDPGAPPRVLLARAAGQYEVIDGDTIDAAAARHVFARTGEISRIDVNVAGDRLRDRPAAFPSFRAMPPERPEGKPGDGALRGPNL